MKTKKKVNTGDEELVIRSITTSPKEHFEGRWRSGRLYPLYSVVVNNGTTFVSQNAKMKDEPYVIYDATKKEFRANEGWKIKEMSADSRLTALGGGSGGGVTPEEVEEMIAGKQDVIPDLETIRSGASNAYQKPGTGIPKGDLSSSVRASLDKADLVTGKQDVIPDLATIRADAAAGATALQSGDLKTINNTSLVGTGDISIPKGDKGDPGDTPDISIGTVSTGAAGSAAAATITGTPEAPVLNLTIPQGLKGDQGNTGSSIDYPYELINNLTTDDATKGLSAAQGKVLDGKVSQLEAKVDALNNMATVTQDGMFFVDQDLNIGVYIDSSGIHAPNIPEINLNQ